MRKRDIFQSLLIFYVLGLHFGIGFCVATPAPHPAAYQFTVNYGEYCYLYNTCETSIDWSFSGSNTFIGLEAWIFNEENFKKFQNDESPTGWKVSSGSYYADQGSQALNDCDVWYFVVINSDPDQIGRASCRERV